MAPTSRIAAAVAVAVNSDQPLRRQQLQAAMTEAVTATIAAAAASGQPMPSDAAIKAAMMTARRQVLGHD